MQFATRAQVEAGEVPKQLNHLVRRAAPPAARGNLRQKNPASGIPFQHSFIHEIIV